MERKLIKSVNYTIRIKEEDLPKIEQARACNSTMTAMLLRGADATIEDAKRRSA